MNASNGVFIIDDDLALQRAFGTTLTASYSVHVA